MKFNITLFVVLAAQLAWAQIPISQARTQAIGSSVTVSGIVTNGDEMGPIRYIQDATAAIPAYPGSGSIPFSVSRGDSITITGDLKDYNGLLEIDPITAVTVHSSGNTLPAPVVIDATQMGESTEGELVELHGISFPAGGQNFAVGTYNFIDSLGNTGVIYVRSGHDLIGDLVPLGQVDLIGIMSQFSFTGFGGYQILPRDINDLIIPSGILFASGVEQDNITTSGFDLTWLTTQAGTAGVQYGLTATLELGEQTTTTSSNTHTVSLSGLSAGEVYYCRPYAVNGTDTAWGNIDVYATQSTSSGRMVAYFNNPVETSVAVNVTATYLENRFNDTIKAYIDMAQNTLDLAIYNNNDATIVNAINAAEARGVRVRYISESSTANLGLNNLNSSIPRLDANASGIMHNKFIVIDADDAQNAHVITGSTNFSPNNLFDDPNNLIIIQDESLAKAFEMEFNEMWGSDGANYDLNNSKIGNQKLNNTPHSFLIGTSPVELYFSPSDGTTGQIEEAIRSTDNYFSFAVMAFTRDDLGQAIIDVNNQFGTIVQGVIEDVNGTGSEFTPMQSAGVFVRSHGSFPNNMHHKYCIIDMPAGNDPIVVTGSHNWSTSAETVNDENTLIIHDQNIADVFYQEFRRRFDELNIGLEEIAEEEYTLYPNPASNRLYIALNAQNETMSYRITDISGRVIMRDEFTSQTGEQVLEMDISQLGAGTYFYTLNGTTKRFIVAQ